MRIYLEKIKRKLWSKMVTYTRKTLLYTCLYRSYWHSLFLPIDKLVEKSDNYFTAKPNPGAGIGHQLANWIAGYWWAKQLGLKFAHYPFSNPDWESFFGFGAEEATVKGLIKLGFKKVLLPYFSDSGALSLQQIRRIIDSYKGQKVVFVCEADQAYRDQYGVIPDIQRKFYSATSRKEDKLIFNKDFFNIAIHVRRGDILIGQENGNPNLVMRWQENDYFVHVLENVLQSISCNKPTKVYLFSQGLETDFEDFKRFPNIQFCLTMNAQDSFLHMVFADLLITSKSSFSYKPALLSKGIKVCPKDFWHGYPGNQDWVLADEKGNFDKKKLESVI